MRIKPTFYKLRVYLKDTESWIDVTTKIFSKKEEAFDFKKENYPTVTNYTITKVTHPDSISYYESK